MMSAGLITGAVLGLGQSIIDRLWPDPAQRAAAQIELLKMTQTGELKQLEAELQMALGQLEVNKTEAASPDFFSRGWRPFVGWVCGMGLTYQFLIRPGLAAAGLPAMALEMETLLTLLFGMLGLGGLRTAEKLRGRA